MPRLHILPAEEARRFDTPPLIQAGEQSIYFKLPDTSLLPLPEFRKVASHVGLIVSLGYFRYSKRFYLPTTFHSADVGYVQELLGYDKLPLDWTQYSHRMQSLHHELIRETLGWQPFRLHKSACEHQAAQLVQLYWRPRSVLNALVTWLKAARIEVPSYHSFTEIITGQYRAWENDLTNALAFHITPEQQELLENLLVATDGDSQFTKWKGVSHSLRPRQIKYSVELFKKMQPVITTLAPLIEVLALPASAIGYLAGWAQKATLFQMQQSRQRYLYLVAFCLNYYRVRQDLLADILLVSVQSARNAGQRVQQNQYFTSRKTRNHVIRQTVNVHQVLMQQAEQAQIVLRSEGTAEEKLRLLERIFLSDKPDEVLEKRIQLLADEFNRDELQERCQALEERFLWLNNRVAAIMKASHFDPASSDKSLIAAIDHFRTRSETIDKGYPPRDFLTVAEREMLYDGEKMKGQLYKMFLFEKVSDGLRSGALNLLYSNRYRSIDYYLLDAHRWEREKPALLAQTGMDKWADCQVVKEQLMEHLDQQFRQTNERYLRGENSLLSLSFNQIPYVETPRVEKEELEKVNSLFEGVSNLSILDILSDVAKSTGVLNQFEHFTLKYSKQRPSQETFIAVMMAYGCNIGTERMADISKGVSPHTLQNTAEWYFTAENIEAANRHLVSYLDKLPLPNVYRTGPDLHTSSDGQKYGVGVDSLNAGYSYKYFGHGKGSTVYNFIDERYALFYDTVVNSSLRDAPYVIDGLLQNEVLKSDIHSTDTHGFSEVIFALTHFISVYFAPRIKGYGTQQLYGFIARKEYQAMGYQILPDKRINWELIEENWDSILRLIVTLQLKQVTASQLLKRLSEYSIQHPLYKALKEFGRVIKTAFLLRFLDDTKLRQAIEKQLNKIELSHKFAKAIFFGNNQEFMVGSKEEQEIVAGCRRFIQNAIILWNYLYLSQKITEAKSPVEKERILAILQSGSIITWQHINLHGEYDFTRQSIRTNFDLEMIMNLKFEKRPNR